MLSSPDHLGPVVFDGTLKRHIKSSSKDGLQWHLPTGLFEV